VVRRNEINSDGRECVHSAREQASFYVGMASLLVWMCALMPQIYANYKNKDASSLSLGYLIQATLGDTCNMLGCILSGQLMTQIIVAAYFVSMDIIIIGQYIYYKSKEMIVKQIEKHSHKHDDEHQHEEDSHSVNSIELEHLGRTDEDHTGEIHLEEVHTEDHSVSLLNPSQSKTRLNINITLGLFVVIGIYLILQIDIFGNQVEELNHHRIGRQLSSLREDSSGEDDKSWSKHDDFVFPPNTTISIIGYVIACICSTFYLGSRLPQIYRNVKRGSAEGLSKIFFALAVLGNTTYFTSVWLFSSNGEYLMMRLPFLVETHFNVVMDSIIFFQIIYYSRKSKKVALEDPNIIANKKESITTEQPINEDEV